jgi:hypothetical protein
MGILRSIVYDIAERCRLSRRYPQFRRDAHFS